jgi:predicted nuclease of predicted toxin-antitoxin system
MRILLDESVPSRLGSLLTGHSTITVQRRGWASIKNGKLLALARSNRIEDLAAALPVILSALAELPPQTLRKVAA